MAKWNLEPARLRILVVAQYCLALFSALSIAAGVYQTIDWKEGLVISSSILSLSASGLSTLYLLLHSISAWRYVRNGCYRHLQRPSLLLVFRDLINFIAILIWAGASAVDLILASNSPFCSRDPAVIAYWDNDFLAKCKVQKAETAVALMAFMTSTILFSTARMAQRSVAASMAGVYFWDRIDEEDLHLATTERWSGPRYTTQPRKRSHETCVCTPSLRNSATGQDEWLPKLSFESPGDLKHPVRPNIFERPLLERLESSQSALLPSPHLEAPSTPIRPPSAQYFPPHKRSHTAGTLGSSVYSQATAVSVFSHPPSRISSVSSESCPNSPLSSIRSENNRDSKPDVPPIPAKYWSPTTSSLRNGGKPMRPRSRPPMPPAQFWDFAREEQKRQNQEIETSPTPKPPTRRPRRHTETAKRRKVSITRYPELLGPFELAGTNAVGQKQEVPGDQPDQADAYEKLRKGVSMPVVSPPWMVKPDLSDIFDECATNNNVSNESKEGTAQRKGSRTLVKMRQPWDNEPRSNLKQ